MHCELPKISGHTMKERIAFTAQAQRIPMQADIEIIATCNYKCVHCYIAPCAEREDVMSVDNARIVLQKLADAGCLTVLLTGGEVLTHKHFREIYLLAKQMGFIIYVNTNGYLIGKRWADFFSDYPPQIISISLYGATSETYSKVTGIPNSWERCVRGIDLLLERGLKVDLKCPALSLTADEMVLMQEFAKARDIDFRYDPILVPQRLGRSDPLSLQMSPEQIVQLDRRMDPGLARTKEYTANRVGYRAGQEKVYQCGAGITGLAVNVHGEVFTCLTSRMPVGNLLKQPWDEVWGALGGKVQVKFPEGHPCATCQFRSMCSGCPATVEQLTGLPQGYVQHFCKITHLQAHALGYHPTGVPKSVDQGLAAGVKTPTRDYLRMLPVLN